jgi:hypothetical protein
MRSGIRFGICTLLLVAGISVIGCSGGSGKSAQTTTYTVGGTVTGFTGAGLVLQNNGSSNLTVSANATSFTFATPVATGGVYSVTVFTQPAGENCTVANGNGTATANVANVSVTCTPQFSIGGTITGLTAPGLVLQDNSGDNLAMSAGATSFTFPTPLSSESTYSVAVLTQPTGENCTVANGSGTAKANVTNISVTCTQLYGIGGTVTGLKDAGLVLQDNGGDNLTVSAGATSFSFATPIAGGSAYSVTVLTQPAGENCTVTGGTGTVLTDVDASVVCTGEWAWMGGNNTVDLNSGVAGVYGTLGVSSPTNIPGGRSQSATWKDAQGNLWLFGGSGNDATDTLGQLNDLWKFDPTKGTSGEWTWMSGSSTLTVFLGANYRSVKGAPGIYGTLGVASLTNVPGGREQAVTWTDKSGNFWLFGGLGFDSVGMEGYLNDIWEFNPKLGTNGEWIWMGGSNTVPPADLVFFQPYGMPGVYGTQGQAASTNTPGGRYGAYAWADQSGNLWLYGGNGFDANDANGYLNDLWKYTPGANNAPGEWTWMSGNSTVPPAMGPGEVTAMPGVYGTLGVPDSANIPGGRSAGVTWTDASGNFWLLGGLGGDSTGNTGYLNDLWEYTQGANGSVGEWTWMSGGNTIGNNGGQPGVYGVLGLPDSANTPGARFSGSVWTDASGHLWLFGGQGYDWVGSTAGFLNDLWQYTPGTNGDLGTWTWMGGSNTIPPSPGLYTQGGQTGVYGTLGTPASTNTPGSRIGAVPWMDASGNLWLFGGQGYDSAGVQGNLNDSWKFQQ